MNKLAKVVTIPKLSLYFKRGRSRFMDNINKSNRFWHQVRELCFQKIDTISTAWFTLRQ